MGWGALRVVAPALRVAPAGSGVRAGSPQTRRVFSAGPLGRRAAGGEPRASAWGDCPHTPAAVQAGKHAALLVQPLPERAAGGVVRAGLSALGLGRFCAFLPRPRLCEQVAATSPRYWAVSWLSEGLLGVGVGRRGDHER